jgi:hypothetical protein
VKGKRKETKRLTKPAPVFGRTAKKTNADVVPPRMGGGPQPGKLAMKGRLEKKLAGKRI